jgi:hypothetical protein
MNNDAATDCNNIHAMVHEMQTELQGVHRAQQMLIETNQTHHMELATFKECFNAQLPKIATAAGAKTTLMDAITLIQEFAMMNPYFIELNYEFHDDATLQSQYRLYNINRDGSVEGTWHHYQKALPFIVRGHPGKNLDNFPLDVMWHSIDELSTHAVDMLVSGAYGWNLTTISVGALEKDYDNVPVWSIKGKK